MILTIGNRVSFRPQSWFTTARIDSETEYTYAHLAHLAFMLTMFVETPRLTHVRLEYNSK